MTHYLDTQSDRSLRDQLRLFAYGTSSNTDTPIAIQTDLNTRERLAALLEGELDFHGESSAYGSHALHAFAAKFPPQLPRVFIRGLTKPGDAVLDPMMGSGTTIVEALTERRKAVGFDIDPLSVRLVQAKTLPLDIHEVVAKGREVVNEALMHMRDTKSLDRKLESFFDENTKKFIDYWFLASTQRELMALVLAIQEIDNVVVRRFLELTFSSIIVTKSGGVSVARDLAHTRPHRDGTKVPKNAIEQFSTRIRKNAVSMAQLDTDTGGPLVSFGDAKRIPLASNSVDLIVTSPPYANAIDYMRAHKFSLVWFKKTVAELGELRAAYIGSERIGRSGYGHLPETVERVIATIGVLDRSKAKILRKYFLEMGHALSEMHRVLKYDAVAVVVVGTSVMRGVNVQTHKCLADVASQRGFEVVGISRRALDRNRRMMPARFGKSQTLIEQRMHEEYVLGLLKS